MGGAENSNRRHSNKRASGGGRIPSHLNTLRKKRREYLGFNAGPPGGSPGPKGRT